MQVLLQYQSKCYYIYRTGGLLQYIIEHLLHYRAFFITLSGTYYSIGRLLHYRLVQVLLQNVEVEIKIWGEVARATHNINFVCDSSSKSVDTGAIN